MGGPVSVAFNGCDTGRVEAIVKAVKATDRPYVSGGPPSILLKV
jgi:hypothetical protein